MSRSQHSEAVQDHYPEEFAHCFGCGRLNIEGHQLKTYVEGEAPSPRFVTASLHVDYLRPTPLGPQLEIRGRVREMGTRKAVVEATVSADGVVTARGEVVAVRMPDTMAARDRPPGKP
jgi:acyl-coenzyme A thioesterase PaaI-like protein